MKKDYFYRRTCRLSFVEFHLVQSHEWVAEAVHGNTDHAQNGLMQRASFVYDLGVIDSQTVVEYLHL